MRIPIEAINLLIYSKITLRWGEGFERDFTEYHYTYALKFTYSAQIWGYI